jgi:protein-disulfide isomerase
MGIDVTTPQDSETEMSGHPASLGRRSPPYPRCPPVSSDAPARLRPLLVPFLALLVVGALTVAALSGGGGTDGEVAIEDAGGAGSDPVTGDERTRGDPPRDADALDAYLLSLERREAGDPLAVGDPDAPVLAIVFSDFQCPFCAAFARDVMPELEERYVDDGTLRIEWRDLPVLGAESTAAAIGARAAARQGAFWELHDEIFAVDRERNVGELAPEELVAMAEGLGLDADRFAQDLEDDQLAAAVDADLQVARSLGLTGTPAFLINGRPLMGGHPVEVFEAAIDELAAEAEADAA